MLSFERSVARNILPPPSSDRRLLLLMEGTRKSIKNRRISAMLPAVNVARESETAREQYKATKKFLNVLQLCCVTVTPIENRRLCVLYRISPSVATFILVVFHPPEP